jgi:hypothetical protein
MLTTSLTRADASMSTFTTPRIYTCLTDATSQGDPLRVECRATSFYSRIVKHHIDHNPHLFAGANNSRHVMRLLWSERGVV